MVRLFVLPPNMVQCLQYQGAGCHSGQIDRTIPLHFIPDIDDKFVVCIKTSLWVSWDDFYDLLEDFSDFSFLGVDTS